MEFVEVVERLSHLMRRCPELGPYGTVVQSMGRWSLKSAWPEPKDYGHLLGCENGSIVFGASCGSTSTIRFVDQRHLASGRWGAAHYVSSIADHGLVPTRFGSVHDLTNAMTWAAFPRLKWQVFQCLSREYKEFDAAQAVPGRGRTPASDLFTQFDEAGVLGCGPSRILFGHALLEHLILGRSNQINAPMWLTEQIRGLFDSEATGLGQAALTCQLWEDHLGSGASLAEASGTFPVF
jgi:hypothetical protein